MAGISQIRIDQQMAEIGVRSTPAKMSIKQPRMFMRMSQEIPRMELETTMPKFKVNRKKLNADMNLHAPDDFTKKHRDMGKAAVIKGMKTASADADFLGNAKVRGQKVGQLVRNKAMANATRKAEFNVALMPKEGPEINWEKGSINVNWSKQSLIVDWNGDFMPELTVEPKHSVELYLRTKPYFRISVQEAVSPTAPGRYINSTI